MPNCLSRICKIHATGRTRVATEGRQPDFVCLRVKRRRPQNPDLYIGTSHSQLNFNIRDVNDESDRIPSFATAHIADDPAIDEHWIYRVSYRRIDGQRPTNNWIESDCDSARSAADLIRDAMTYADVPQRN